jgi:hypothetical protein
MLQFQKTRRKTIFFKRDSYKNYLTQQGLGCISIRTGVTGFNKAKNNIHPFNKMGKFVSAPTTHSSAAKQKLRDSVDR